MHQAGKHGGAAPTLWMKLAKCILWNVEEKWKARGAGLGFGGEGAMVVCRQLLDHERMQHGLAKNDGIESENKSSAYEDGTQAPIPVVDEHVCQRNGRTDGHLKWSTIMVYSFREEV